MVSNNSKKIKKPAKFGDLVQQKSHKLTKVVQNRNSLIKEYQARNKTSKVEDRRFLAKRDPTQKFLGNIERGKKKKLAFFNVDSDDEDMKLTHKGVNIEELDDFKDNDIEKSISDDDNINAEMVENLHFGGFDEGEKNEDSFNERRKTKQEIYKELIHKSKKMKFLRQQQQMENEEKIEELDEGFDDIVHLLVKNPNQYKEQKKAKVKDDIFLSLQSELAFDRRIKPESVNAQDPKLGKKNKKNKEAKEDEDDDSELGVDEEPVFKTKQERKLKNELKAENKTKKLVSFLDEIKKLKDLNENSEEEKEDSLDELDIGSEDDMGEDDDEEGDDDDMEDGGDEGDDGDEGDEDEGDEGNDENDILSDD